MRSVSFLYVFAASMVAVACSGDATDPAQEQLAQELRRGAPTIESVSPSSGPTTGGVTVEVVGTNFRGGTSVAFGGIAATNVSVTSSRLLRATVPAHAAGSVAVSVTDSRGRTATLDAGFAYAAVVAPPDGGTTPPPPPPPPADAGTQLFTAPTLINPVSPLQYGAKCDGVTDDSAAFQAALNASDVKVPAGTCVINRPVTISMSNRHLECSAGTTLKQTDGFAGRMFNIRSWSATERLTGDSIVNCTFLGANTEAPQYYNDDNRHWNIPVQTQDRVDNFFLAGNTFSRFFGQSMFQTYGGVDGGSGTVIVHNTFKSCGYYGPVLVAHKNGYIGHNTLVDCSLGIENDDPAQVTGNNIIEYNTLTAVHGYGAPDMGASVMLTGGAAANANYSTNIVRNNTVSGVSDALGFQGAGLPSEIYQQAPGGPAQYLNNVCGIGCRIIR